MKIKLIAVLATSGIFFTSGAMAECTEEVLMEKVPEAMVAIQAIADKDPSRGQELGVEMQELARKMQADESGGNPQEACDFYDKVIDEANG